ncbi:MAG: DUF5119 domain-containing protein [Muribaculaceae bacterium]|nr:DUF5119 domain-containing protein [Muribaculaceae bacterium]
MKKISLIAAMASVLIPLLTSCDHKELCMDHWDHAARYQVNFQAEWDRTWEYTHEGENWKLNWQNYDFSQDYEYEDLLHEKGTGIRSQVYTDGHDNELRNHPAEGGIVYMTPGEHQILFYNNDTEYIVFNDISLVANASATTRTRSRSTYHGNSKAPQYETRADETTVNPPDKLFAKYIESYSAEKAQVAPIENITLRPLVFRYLIRYHFKSGAEYIRLARGALSGMAGSVFLSDGHTGPDPVTVLFDGDPYMWGVEAVVNTFGVPNFPNPDYTRAPFYGLNLEVRLGNGELLSFDFDITDQILKQPRGGVIEIYDLEIPDDIGNAEDKGAFGVAIDDWGEYQDVTFDIGKK